MFRSFAARTFSARQKSTLRNLAYSLGGYAPRQVERFVDDIVTEDNARSFLQIGANDGYSSDPLNLAIFRHKLTGAFVEPQPNYMQELRKTYRNFPGMSFVPCAVSAESGSMTMYTLDCSGGRLPGWARGVGTLSRDQILKFGDQIPKIESYIRTTTVDCITVPQLLDRVPVRDPDILTVDAEGFDHAILAQFDLAAMSAKLVIYESESMTAADAAALAKNFEAAGFALFDAGQDTLALKRDTSAYRKWAGQQLQAAA